jgi:amidase/aspartyl-tRNA(Asn)/glutamyl-tRNA(Gln) amidotransferase subunit A
MLMEGTLGLSAHHAISRSVRDSALLLDLSAGPEAGARVLPPGGAPGSYLAALTQAPGPLRIAVWRSNHFGVPVHADCLAALDAAAKVCESLGHRLQERWLELPVQEIFSGMGTAMGAAMLHTISQREKLLGRSVREDEMEPLDWAALQQARQATAQQLYAARLGFDRAAQLIDAFFSHYDLVLTPTTAVPAQKLGVLRLDQPFESYAREAMNSSAFTSLFNISGHPAMSVPAHWTAQGLPVGAHFVAPYGREDRLLSLAAQLEQAMPWAHRTPDLTPLQA